MKLDNADMRHLLAAQGWLELGDWKSAHDELENVQPQIRAHPDVLKMRVDVFSAAGKWDYVIETAGTLARLLPDHAFGHVRLAYALHEMKRTKEACDALLPVADTRVALTHDDGGSHDFESKSKVSNSVPSFVISDGEQCFPPGDWEWWPVHKSMRGTGAG